MRHPATALRLPLAAATTTLLVLLVLLSMGPAAQAAAPAVVLDDGNFDSHVLAKPNEMWLVEFYAPWCGHCKQLTPIFDEAAPKARTYGMRMGKIDATANTVTAKRYGVKGYPTLLYFRKNTARRYRARRDVEGFVAFAKMMKKDPVVMVTSTHALDAIKKKKPVTYFLGQPQEVEGGDLTGTAAYKVFHDAAYMLQDQFQYMAFVANTGNTDDVLEQKSKKKDKLPGALGSKPFIVRIEKGEKHRYFDLEGLLNGELEPPADDAFADPDALPPAAADGVGDADEDGGDVADYTILVDWIERQRHKVFTPLTRENFYLTTHSKQGAKVAVAIVDPEDPRTRSVKQTLHQLARSDIDSGANDSESFLYGWLDGIEYKDFIKEYGLNPRMLPQVMVFDAPSETYYWRDGIEMPGGMAEFLQDTRDGKVFGMRQGFWWDVDMIHFMILEFWPYSLIVVVLYLVMFAWLSWQCKRCMCDDDDDGNLSEEDMKAWEEYNKIRASTKKKQKDKLGKGE